MPTVSIQTVTCRGSFRHMGEQYGEQARTLIRRELDLRQSKKTTADQAARDTQAAAIRAELQRHLPDVLTELEGIAAGADVPLAAVLLANHVDLNPETDRCTPIILRESPDGPIIAKNNDAPPHEENPFVLRICHPDHGLPCIHLTYAGWLSGLDAMNADGLANTHASVGSRFSRPGPRIDIRLVTYQLMRQCRTLQAFSEALQQTPLTGKGFNVAVADRTGDTAIIDAAVPLIAVRDRQIPFAYATNIYRAPGLENADLRPPQKRDICLLRSGYLRWIESENPPRTLADMKKLLSSHEPWAPCRHGGPHGSVTLWSLIALPQQGRVQVAMGAPCAAPFQEFTL